MANTLAYYDTATITAVKSFIVQAPGGQSCKTFYGSNLRIFRNKLECLSLAGADPKVEYLKGASN